MKKLLIVLFSVLLLCSPVWAAVENFTSGWTLDNTNAKFTVTSSRVSWSGLTDNMNDGILKDAGVSWTGDIDFKFVYFVNSSSQAGYVPYVWQAAATDWSASIYSIGGEDAGGKVYLSLEWWDGSGGGSDTDNTTLLLDTAYYIRVKKDDNGGVGGVGQVVLKAYTTEANMQSETSPVLTLSIDLTASADYTQFFGPYSLEGGHTTTHTGYFENLDLSYVPPTARRMISTQ